MYTFYPLSVKRQAVAPTEIPRAAFIHGIRPATPTLLISGYVGADLLLRARDVGADDVLKKPLSMRQLALSLSRALGQ